MTAEPLVPLPPGAVAADVVITPAESTTRLWRAFAIAVTGTAIGADDRSAAVWVDGDNELVIRPNKLRVAFDAGYALIGIAVFTEQTGEAEVVVPFALGDPKQPFGLVVATEPLPRGPALIVETWGDQLIAAAWDALLEVATATAAAAGIDDGHEPLLPAAVMADKLGLRVTPQARHGFDRRLR